MNSRTRAYAKRILDEVKRSPSNPKWYEKNVNPWNFQVNDCVLRAYSIGLLMKYEFLYAMAVGFENSSVWSLTKTEGFINGMDDGDLAKALPPGFVGPETECPGGTDLNGFLDEMAGKPGVYVVSVGEGFANHVVCAYVGKRPYFVDSFDSGGLKAFSYRKILKQVPKSDPRRLDLRTLMKPDSWKKKFRETFFRMAAEWERGDASRRAEIADMMDFVVSGELYDDGTDMDEIAGKDVLDLVDGRRSRYRR